MKTKVLQFYRILIRESYKAICLLLVFIICFHFDSNAQVQRLDSIPIVNLGPDGNVCDNEPRLLNAYNIGCTYEWKFNDSIISDTSFIFASKAGTYSVKVISPDSLEAFDTIKLLITNAPNFYISIDFLSGIDTTVTFSSSLKPGGYLYLWNFGDPSSKNNISQLGNPNHKFKNLDTWVRLSMFDVRTNCTNIDSIKIESWMFFWGINSSHNEFYKVRVSPNPITSSSKLSFTVKNPSSTVSLKACDLLGREQYVFFENQALLQGENSIDLSSYFNSSGLGIRLLKLNIDGNPMCIKVVK